MLLGACLYALSTPFPFPLLCIIERILADYCAKLPKIFEASPATMDEDKGPKILALCWTFTALSSLFVAARLYARYSVHRKIFADDYWIILSTASSHYAINLVGS